MAFVFLLAFLMLAYLFPADVFPVLAPFHIALWIGVAGLIVTTLEVIVKRRTALFTLQFGCLASFAVVSCASLMIAERWLGAPVAVLSRFGPALTLFVLAAWSVDSLWKLRVATASVVVLSLAVLAQAALAYHTGLNAEMFLLNSHAPVPNDTSADSGLPWATFEPRSPEGDAVEATAQDALWDDDGETTPREIRIRGMGLLNDPNDLALALVVAVALIGGVWRLQDRMEGWLLLPVAVLGYGVFLTRSRGGALAFLVVIARALAGRLGSLPAIALTALLVTGAAAIDYGGGRSLTAPLDEAASGRVTAWTEGLEMLKSRPLLGVGFGQFSDYHELTAHNSFVLCFAETGTLGYFFWMGLLIVTFVELRSVTRLEGDDSGNRDLRHVAYALELSLCGFVTAAFFLSRTFIPMLYLLIGLSVALASIARDSGHRISMPRLHLLAIGVLASEVASIALIWVVVKLHLA